MRSHHRRPLWLGTFVGTLMLGCAAEKEAEEQTTLPIIIPPGPIIPLPHAQQRCSSDWSASVATNLGAAEFDKDLRYGGNNYGMNARFIWPLHVSSNALWMNPHTLNWNTFTGDYLRFNASGAIVGNQGTKWWTSNFPPDSSGVISVEWNSDDHDTLPGFPKVDKVRFQCRPDSQQTGVGPIRPIGLNERNDAVFFNPNDVLYFSVTQPFNRALFVTLDVNAASSDANFDLRASDSFQRPSLSNYTWGDLAGSTGSVNDAGGVLFIDANGQNRTVYIGVNNASGLGHVSLRANAVETRTITVCTQDMTVAQVKAHPGWPNVDETMRRTMLRVLQLTNGNLFINRVRWKLQSSGLIAAYDDSKKFCNDDPNCDVCMTGYGLPPASDGCGYQTQGSTGKMRVANVRCQGSEGDSSHVGWDAQRNLSHKLGHEAGHALGRLYTQTAVPTVLRDQYIGDFPEPQSAHSIMNGPWPPGQLDTSYRFSTDLDHCKPNDPEPIPMCPWPRSDWRTIKDSGLFPKWIYPNSSMSSQPWLKLFDNVRAQQAIRMD